MQMYSRFMQVVMITALAVQEGMASKELTREFTCLVISGMEDCKPCKNARQLAEILSKKYKGELGFSYETVPFLEEPWNNKLEQLHEYLPDVDAIQNKYKAPFIWMEKMNVPVNSNFACTTPDMDEPIDPEKVVWIGGFDELKKNIESRAFNDHIETQRERNIAAGVSTGSDVNAEEQDQEGTDTKKTPNNLKKPNRSRPNPSRSGAPNILPHTMTTVLIASIVAGIAAI